MCFANHFVVLRPCHGVCFVTILFLSAAPIGRAQQQNSNLGRSAFPQAQPEDLDLRIPAGDPKPGGDRRVMVLDRDEPVVAKVHVEVSGSFIVLLPDGRLTTVDKDTVTLTERPFEPATKKKMIEELAEKFPRFTIRRTRRYVYVFNCSDAFRKATGKILETMYPALYAYVERQEIPVHPPLTPLVVVLFRTEDEFHAYRKMPEGVAAYYNGVSNRVVMYEQSSLTQVAPELAMKQSVSIISHEGVHQILHNIGVQKRLSRWPMWISEGLPEYFAPTEVGRRIRWKGVGLTHDLRMHNLIDHVKKSGNRPKALTLQKTIDAERLDSLGYAKSWALVHYLAKRKRKEFVNYLRAVSELQPLRGRPPAGKLFAEHFEGELAKHEEQMFEHLAKLKYVDPIINQTHYVVMIETDRFRRWLVTPSPQDIQIFKRQAQGTGRFQIKAFGTKPEAVRFAKSLEYQ